MAPEKAEIQIGVAEDLMKRVDQSLAIAINLARAANSIILLIRWRLTKDRIRTVTAEHLQGLIQAVHKYACADDDNSDNFSRYANWCVKKLRGQFDDANPRIAGQLARVRVMCAEKRRSDMVLRKALEGLSSHARADASARAVARTLLGLTYGPDPMERSMASAVAALRGLKSESGTQK